MAGFLEMLVGDPDRRVGWRGADHQYADAEELTLEVDEAWTEMELRSGGELIGIWRLQMVREEGMWKACSAELRSKSEGGTRQHL